MRSVRIGRSFALLAVLLAACASGRGQVSPAASTNNATPRMTPSTLNSMVDAALDDAARRTRLDRSQLIVVSAEPVTWTDGSLGCPQPDMAYTQALVPGYRIRIRAAAEVLDYHAGQRGPPVLCPPSRSVEPAPAGPT